MAEKRNLPLSEHDEHGAPKNDITALLNHVREHPALYLGAVGFVLIVLAATGIYRVMQSSSLRDESTKYVRALETDDPAERSAAFAEVAESSPMFTARALYLEGESALDAGNYDAARAAFNELRERHPGFEFVPDAVEGLGFIEEDSGAPAAARKLYEEVAAKWPESAAAQRQPFNLARCYEAESDLASAVAQYRKQLETFPGSTIAVRAQQRLNELRETNSDLFADEAVVADTPVLQELTTDPASEPLNQLELSIDKLPSDSETPAPETPPQE